jgi:hypothetical protein
MLDKLLDAGCGFDWITPTFAFIQDIFYGPVSDFGISPQAGWDRGDIKRLLNNHGVRVWGLIYNVNWDMLMFTVPKTQARWAYYLLQREGVPILCAPSDASYSPGNNKFTDPLEPAFLEKHLDSDKPPFFFF